MALSVPEGRRVSTTPVTVSSAPSTVPVTSGMTSPGGAFDWPQPNHMKAKNPKMTTVTPRSSPVGNQRAVLSNMLSS